jgi:zinc finger protein
MESTQNEPIYIDINPDCPVSEIESLCMNCELNGVTRILPTKIPFFKEIIVMAFDCPHCGYKSSEVQPGQTLADDGLRIEIQVTSQKDLNRRVVKSEYAHINIPECELEIPKNTQKGKLTTIEGFLTTAKEQMESAMNDGVYKEMGEETEKKIAEVISKIDNVLQLKTLPITFIIDDPAGNSFVENPFAPNTDQYAKVKYYQRTKEMAQEMGYQIQAETEDKAEETELHNKKVSQPVQPTYYNKRNNFEVYKSSNEVSAHLIDFTKSIQEGSNDIHEEALRFPTHCYCCHEEGEAHMCICTIPFFKEIIIICFKCDICGFKNTEVKGGGGISEKACKYTLTIKDKDDLNRDCFKSETAQMSIPELGFETDTGSMGSMYTTVEGLVDKVIRNLRDTPFYHGDSTDRSDLGKLITKLETLLENNQEFTIILDDPLSNSFISPLENDTRLTKEVYERTWEQDEELGINDMNVENYTEEENK